MLVRRTAAVRVSAVDEGRGVLRVTIGEKDYDYDYHILVQDTRTPCKLLSLSWSFLRAP
jgi:hypothetical protein